MGSKLDLIGHKYTRLTVKKECSFKIKNEYTWECICDCGKIINITTRQLRTDNVKSCGCLKKDHIKSVGLKNRKSKGLSGLNNLYSRYKRSAKKRGVEFDLDLDTFTLLTKCPCYYCGTLPSQKITPTSRTSSGLEHASYVYNGIDRVDSNIGYVPNNMLPCCKVCNYAKLEMSIQEFKEWIKRVHSNFIGRINV